MENDIEINSNIENVSNPDEILSTLGYDKSFWDLVESKKSSWDQKGKNGDKTLYSCKVKVKPKLTPEFNPNEFLKIFESVCNNLNVNKTTISKSTRTTLDKDKLMLISSIELHLGKIGWSLESGFDYNKTIASDRVKQVTKLILKTQVIRKCDTALLIIGNDYFNADGISQATTHGTPQQMEMRWQDMFQLGLELYVDLIESIKSEFNNIEIKLVAGNHARSAEFYLFSALKQRYSQDSKFIFDKDFKETKSYTFGSTSLFFNHGDVDDNRLCKSLPAEFPKEWSSARFRELHLYHFHKDSVKLDNDLGLVIIRNPSPCSTDYWHYHNRFIGINPSYTIYEYDRELGRIGTDTINFIQ
jgi:hypothetical protein